MEVVDWAVAETKGGRWVDREGSGKIPRAKGVRLVAAEGMEGWDKVPRI